MKSYPKYTIIYQICYIPKTDHQYHIDLYDGIHKLYPDNIIKKELKNSCDWVTIMDEIITECKNNNSIVPILHIDTHGCKDGFGISTSPLISWFALIFKIKELNEVCNGNLFLSLNVCEGLLIYRNRPDGCEVKDISLNTIGSCDKINTVYGKNCFLAMYTEYFNSYSMDKAIQMFFNENRIIERQPIPFVLIDNYIHDQ